MRQQTVGCLVGRVHNIEINIRAVASRRGIGHDVPSVRPDVADIARLAVGEQPDVPGTDLVAIELKPLSTADVFAEDKITAAVGMVRSTRDAIGEEGQLGPRAAGHLDFVDLRRIGEARADKHLAPRRMPGKDGGTAKLGVPIGSFGDRRGNRGNALHDKILARRQRRRGGGRLCGAEPNN